MNRSQVFDRLYDHYYTDLYQYVFYRVGNQTLAEDLTQDVFIRALTSYDQFRGESTEKTWLFAIARRAVIDWYRKRKREVLFDFTQWRQPPSEDRLPDELAEANDTKRLLYEAIQQLKPQYRDVVILRSIQECSLKEAAEIMGWNVTKVKVTQHRALKKLKELIGPNFNVHTSQEVSSP